MTTRSGATVIAFALAVAAGIAGFRSGGAPNAYAAINAVAALVAIALAALFRRLPAERIRLCALCAGPAMVAATLIFGPELEGVQRWLPLGPIRLHAATLLGPAFVIALQTRDDRWGTAACVTLAGIIALQPDMGAAIALCGATAFSLAASFRPHRVMALAAALAALWFTALQPDFLAPVPFVEGVLQSLARAAGTSGRILAVFAGVTMIAAIAAPSLNSEDRRIGGLAMSGWYLGLVVASLIGSYPTPLIGYGAAPIIGYGIAIGMLERNRKPPHGTRRGVI